MVRTTPAATGRDLLVISDLHLGDQLGNRSEHTIQLERALVAFLDHHRGDGRAWQLVINGDMIDLIGVTLMPAELGLIGGYHPDDALYGLGARAQVAAAKLRKIVDYHVDVFRALGRFVADGHTVAIVVGNHDAEFHWPEVQRVLADCIATHAIDAGAGADAADAITFHGWFYLAEGLAWIEHGHQYDPYCSFEDVLEPAIDEEEVDPNLGALLPRYIGPRMAEDIHHAHSHTFFGFLRMWYAQGASRIAGIGQAYVDVVRRMIEHWRARAPERVAARRARARVRLRRVARRLRLPEERLLALAALAIQPVSVDLLRLIRALMVDRLALLLLGPVVALLPFVVLPWSWVPFGALGAALPIAWFLVHALTAREPTDPSDAMRRIARRIRRLARVPIVVMGHSHSACSEGNAEEEGGGFYFNTGTWVPSDPAHAFTHVRIERTERGVRALLCQWRDGASRVYEAAGACASAFTPVRPVRPG